MSWSARIRAFLRSVFRREKFEQEMQAELRFHIESYAEDLVRQGMSRDQALRRARIEFGAVEAQKEDCRASLGLRVWDELRADVRYALRVMRKSPGFTAVAVLTLALGIGANTAIFTLVDAVLLRLVPVPRAQELYQLKRAKQGQPERGAGSFTNPLWENIRQRQDVFSGMAAWGGTDFDLSSGGAVQRAQGLWVNGDYFEMLGVRPALGRLIGASDDVRGCPGVAVLSYRFWRDHYAGSPSVLGSTISLNSHQFEIIGVAAPGFYGLDLGSRFDVAAPICSTALLDGARSRLDVRSWWWLSVVGRVKPNISPEQLKARLAMISSAVFNAATPQNWDSKSQEAFAKLQIAAEPVGSGISWSLRQQYRDPLKILMVVVGMVLLIACANIAALMLARAAAQGRELAVRLALGASRARVCRQLLTHAVMLSLAGAAAGAVLAQWGTVVMVRALATRRVPVFFELTPDWRIVAFTAGVALLTAMIFGMLPAIRSANIPLTEAMRASVTSQTDRRSPLRKWIVASQIALSLVLLVTAGLFLRSFLKLALLDPGFDKKNVLLVNANLKSTSVKPDQQFSVFEALESRFRAMPGAISVGRCHLIPLGGGGWDNYVFLDTPNAPKPQDTDAMMNFISPGYFASMRMALLAGRNFTSTDTKTSAQVVIVNQAFVRKFYSGIDPLGRIIRVPKDDGTAGAPIQVVGIVGDSKYLSLRAETPPTAFFPLSQIPEPESSDTFVVRTAARPESLISATVAAAAGVSREIPLEFATLEQQVDDAMVQERLLAMLSGFFGAVALLLAMVGLYGAVSYRVALRRTEFGIRMALGAQVGAIVRLVIREVAIIVAIGVAAGIAISLAATRTLQKLLFGLGPRDLVTMTGAALLLASVALLAAFAPARRAARVDPMVALRYE